MRKFFVLFLGIMITSCNNTPDGSVSKDPSNDSNSGETKKEINLVLDTWHKDAAEANFEPYFNSMTKDGMFIGTDAGENWNISDFKKFSKPYFDRGTAWNFSTLDRNIYISENGEIAWFDELLETWMGICRGSGVMVVDDGNWKIKHYVLSVTIPNENIDEIVKINREIDSSLVVKLRNIE